MNGNVKFSHLFVMLMGAVIVFSVLGAIFLNDIGSHPNEEHFEEALEEEPFAGEPLMPNERGTRLGSPRTVLAELFTNWDCPPCATANPPLNDLCDVYGPDKLVMIATHSDFPGPDDPFYMYNPTDAEARITYYGVPGYPDAYFDGVINEYGISGSTTVMYNIYKSDIESRLAISSPVAITLDGSMNDTTGTVNARIDVTDTLPLGSFKIRFSIVEDNRYATGSNGEMRHRYVLRQMLSYATLPPLSIGQSFSVSRSFAVDPIWDSESVSIVVYVQNDDNKEVLQAGTYDYYPEKILVVDDDEGPHPDGSEDIYLELLLKLGYSYDGWARDERGSPSESDLSPYEAVIWLTGSSLNTLTAADQTAISGYLDNGYGSLFLTGENIGDDIGSSSFYSDYLRAFYSGNLTGENQVDGVQMDPISDPYYGSPLPIVDTSPDYILPIFPATGIFEYTSSGAEGGLRVDHDADSRIVFFGFKYFEGPDSDADKEEVLWRVLNWVVVKIDNIIFRDAPGDSGNALPIVTIDVAQNKTVWAAAYNNTNGFLANYDTTLWFEDGDGSIVNITSAGPSTFIEAGIISDSVTMEVRVFTYMNTTTVTVNPPGVDYIEIRDSPGGAGSIVSAVTLNVGNDVTLWAAGFNVTTGYIEDVPTTIWIEDSGGTLATVTSPGGSSTITALHQGGVCNVTADVNGAQGTVEVTINDATPDYIIIRNGSGGTGSELADITLNVGESTVLWAGAYNTTAGWIADYPTTVWSESSGGSIATLSPSAGASTTVTAGMDGGWCTVTANYNGMEYSTIVNVNTPTEDYIVIENGPDGSGDAVENPHFPVGVSFFYWGAAYNDTSGYLHDVPSSASWWSNNTAVLQVWLMGTYTNGLVSDTESGVVNLTLQAYGGLSNYTIVTIIPPTIDEILIRNAPDGGGSVVGTQTYEVGENETFYAASYNDTAGHIGDVPASWDSDDELVGTIPGSGSSARFDAVGIGTCIVSLDASGFEAATGTITVEDTTDPAADIGSDFTVDEDVEITFNATASHDNSRIVFFNWSFGDGTTLEGSDPAPQHTYPDPGNYTVTLTVADTGGNTDTADITVTVEDVTAPTAVITLPATVEENNDVLFNGSGSSDNDAIVSYSWEFGDGKTTTGSLPNVHHAYRIRGNYTVNLTVEDAAGLSGSASTTIKVLDVTPPAKPTGLVITQVATGGVLIISWEHVSDSDLDHYELYFAVDSGNFTKLADLQSDVNEYTHKNLDDGMTYQYYVVAVDFAGNPSTDSSTITGIPDMDTDGDGKFNLVDTDDDDDGLSDIKEAQAGSDPLKKDSDEDTHIDGEDAFPVNPKEWEDSDGDGYGDEEEDAFPRNPNEWQDSDGDGVGDNSDFLPSLSNMLFFILVIAIIAAVLVVALLARRRGGETVEFTDISASPAALPPPPAAPAVPPPPPWMKAKKIVSEEKPEPGKKELPPPPKKKEAEITQEEAPAPESPEESAEPAEESTSPPETEAAQSAEPGEESPEQPETETAQPAEPAKEGPAQPETEVAQPAEPRPPRAPAAAAKQAPPRPPTGATGQEGRAKPRPPRPPKKAKPKETEK